MPRQYLISWFVDVDDDSPYEAARQALGMQRDPESTATIFTVRDKQSGESVCIDADSGEEYPSDDFTRDALDAIHAELDGKEWSSDTLDNIAAILRDAGYSIASPDEE